MINKVDIKFIGFFYILIFMFLGATNDTMTILCMIMSAIIAFIIAISASKNQNVNLPKGIITLLMLQNLCIGLGAHLFGNSSPNIKFLTQIPFMTLAIVFFFLFFSKKLINEKKQNKYFILLLVCILISLFVGHGSLLSILINIRNLITFFFAFSIGKLSIRSKDDLTSFINYLFLIAAIMLIFGIILLVYGYDLYKEIGLKEVYIAKGSPIEGERLDSRFTTTLYKNQVIRMGSLLYEPVNLAYFYALTTILAIFYDYSKNALKKIKTIIINALGLILTFGKGGYLIAAALVLLLSLTKTITTFSKTKNVKNAIKTSTIIGFVFLTLFCVYYYLNVGAASSPHFWAIQRTWKSVLLRPIGYGLGTGGNMSFVFNNYIDTNNWLSSGGETALLSFMYQIGFQGILFLILCMLSLKINLKKVTKINSFKIITYFIPFVLLGISILQDNTFTPQCIVPYMLIIGGESSLVGTEKEL